MPVIAIIDYHGVSWIETKELLRKANTMYVRAHHCKPYEEIGISEALDMVAGDTRFWAECPGKKLRVRKLK